VVHDVDGEVIDAGKDLDALIARVGGAARAAVAAAVAAAPTPVVERSGITSWDLGTIPRFVDAPVTSVGIATDADTPTDTATATVRGYPTLLDTGRSVSLRIVTSPDLQARALRGGLRRLLALSSSAPSAAVLRRSFGSTELLAIAGSGFEANELIDDVIEATIDRVVADHDLAFDAAAFEVIAGDLRRRGQSIATDALSAMIGIVALAADLAQRLDRLTSPAVIETAEDARRHLERLMVPHVAVVVGTRRLEDLARALRGIHHRLDRLDGDLARDRRRIAEVVPLERRFARVRTAPGRHGAPAPSQHGAPAPVSLVELGWMLEELRVATFAPALSTGGVSVKRISAALDQLESGG